MIKLETDLIIGRYTLCDVDKLDLIFIVVNL